MLIIFALLAVLLILVEIVFLMRLKSNIDNFAQYWNNRSNESGDITYVALGDSAAQGLGAGDPENGYVGILARRLATKTGKSVRVVNLSKSGARLKDVIDTQLPQLDKYKPVLITLDIGGNDIKNFDAQKYETEMKEIINKLPKGTYISDVPYFTTYFWNNTKVDEANRIFYSITKDSDLNIVPLHKYTKDRISRWRDFAADWFHPNNRGYKVWADAFWSKVNN